MEVLEKVITYFLCKWGWHFWWNLHPRSPSIKLSRGALYASDEAIRKYSKVCVNCKEVVEREMK